MPRLTNSHFEHFWIGRAGKASEVLLMVVVVVVVMAMNTVVDHLDEPFF